MSEITTSVDFTTRIDKAVEKNPSRYALNAVEVIPAGNDRVYATTTDSRQLCVVECAGHTAKRELVPRDVLPKRNPTRGRPHRVERNGRWESSDGRFFTEDVEGRFPNAADVLPNIDTESHLAVTVDVKLLAKMAAALGSDQLTLFVPTENTDRGARVCYANQVIPVIPAGDDAEPGRFGAIMPVTPRRLHDGYNSMRDGYAAAQGSCPR